MCDLSHPLSPSRLPTLSHLHPPPSPRSQSYEQTLETARANYHLRFAQTVLEYKALPPTPPPLYALSLPYEIYTIANGGWKEILFLMKKVCRKKRTKVPDDDTTSPPLLPTPRSPAQLPIIPYMAGRGAPRHRQSRHRGRR
jgi:hypothetical protein